MNPQLADILNSSDTDLSAPSGSLPSAVQRSVASSTTSLITATKPKSVAATTNSASKKKNRTKSVAKSQNSAAASSFDDGYLISTSSPEGIAAASQITPARIARILLAEGPLPIRHLTAQLITQVPSFGHLSLSKQRRLIMAALESGDAATLCVFDKIGWGQWEAKVVPREEFNARAAAIVASSGSSANASASEGVNPPSLGKSSLRRRRNSDRHSISPTGKGLSSSAPSAGFSGKKDHRRSSNSPVRNLTALRRESITNPNTDLHNTKVPGSPTLQPLQTLRNSFRAHNISLDEAIESSSDEEGAAEEGFEIHSHGSVSSGSSPGSGANDDGELFNFESEQQQQLANSRHILRTRSLSSSTNRRPSFGGVAKPRKPRTSFTSHSIEAALDEGAIDSRRPRISFSNPSSVSRQSYLRTSISPRSNPIMIHEQMSSLSIGSGNSTSESGINQIQNKPKKSSGLAGVQQESENYTDEEDWEAMGPSSLRNRDSSSSTNVVSVKKEPERKDEEMTAAIALMDLRTVN